MLRRYLRKLTLALLAVTSTGFLFFGVFSARAQQRPQPRPAIVPRDRSSFSIREGPGSPQTPASRFKRPNPFLGLLPASYNVFFAVSQALGSLLKRVDPYFLGQQSGQQIGFDFSYRSRFRQTRPNVRPGDTPSLGQVCGGRPGDAYWVGYPRPGNVEFGPAFQTLHHPFDCWCRCDEVVTCPRPESPFFHTSFGGNFPFPVSCRACFTTQIRKHDFAVGTGKGSHRGYPISFPQDTGYQECLRQSPESFSASGPGGGPRNPNVFGL